MCVQTSVEYILLRVKLNENSKVWNIKYFLTRYSLERVNFQPCSGKDIGIN